MPSSLFTLFKPSHKVILEALVAGEKSLGELAEALQMSRPAASKHLKELVEAGLIKESMEKTETGRVVKYKLNNWSSFVSIDSNSGRLLAFQTNDVFNQCHLLLEQLEPGEFKEDLRMLIKVLDLLESEDKPEYAILFGSVARGEGNWKSDIDVALLRNVWSERIQDNIESLVSELMVKTQHKIQLNFLRLPDVEKSDMLICQEIRDSGIIIYGDLFGRRYMWQAMKRYRTISI